jgi:hypothetical protein
MSHKWWHKWGSSPEDEALEQLEELRVQENRILQSNEKYGEGAVELSKDDLKEIQDQIKQIKIDNPDVEAIQSGFAADNTGIFGIPQEAGTLENIKELGVNAALDYANAPDIIDYDAATEVRDTFQEEGAGGAANTIVNLVKSYGIEKGIEMAMNTGIPVNTIISVLKSPMLEPWTGPLMSQAGTMFSDLTFGQGPKVWNWMNQPLDLFEGTSGIFGNQQNIVPVNEPVVQQPGVIDQYIASLNQPTVTQNNDGTQTISGGTLDPSDDITVANLPAQVYQPTMADIAGPSTPSLPNTGPPGRPVRGPHWAQQGGLVSMARVLRR